MKKINALLIAILIVGCSQKKADEVTQGELVVKPSADLSTPLQSRVVQNVAYHVMRATYQDLSEASVRLNLSVLQLKADPTEKHLNLAQQAWRETRKPWEASEGFIFGPVESLGIDPKIDTWPLNLFALNKISQTTSESRLDADFIRSQNTNVQGFHTIEYLLFGDGSSSNQKSVNALTSKEMQMLVATTEVLQGHTQQLLYSWTTQHDPDQQGALGYAVLLMNPGIKGNPYPSEKVVIAEYINGLVGIVDEVANGKIKDPMGDRLENADVTKVESPFSWNSVTDFADNVRSVKAVYSGDYGDHQGPGLDELLARKNPELAQLVTEQIEVSLSAIENISNEGRVAFRNAILDESGRARVQVAVDELHTLFDLLDQNVRREFQ